MPHGDPEDFGYVVHAKANAPDLLRRALCEPFPDLADHYQSLYPEGRDGPTRDNCKHVALRLKWA